MEDDTNVRRLVEILAEFFTHKEPVKEDLTCSLTSEFLRNMQDVVFTKTLITFFRWQVFYDSAHDIMVSSPEIYLKYLIYPCLQDAEVDHAIFEKFLNSFALITRINIETRKRKGLDFCGLTPDIFMVLYKKEYRKRFLKRGGFRRLVEYVNNPNYLDSKCVMRNISKTYQTYTSNTVFPPEVLDKLYAMTRKELEILPRNFSFQEVETNRNTSYLVKNILSIARPEHIPFCFKEVPNEDSTQRTPTKTEKESNRIVKTTEKESFDSGRVKQISDNTQYQNIIDQVIRHNRVKSSVQVKSSSRIQKEADGILEHLKNSIKSLIEVLDE